VVGWHGNVGYLVGMWCDHLNSAQNYFDSGYNLPWQSKVVCRELGGRVVNVFNDVSRVYDYDFCWMCLLCNFRGLVELVNNLADGFFSSTIPVCFSDLCVGWHNDH
jgi:hypothetical protein